jgi:DNA-binding winged helix-turn-helix (wHTH) protein
MMKSSDLRVAFGAFTFDASTFELLRDGERVHLSPKAFELLHLLIEQRPKVVRRQMLEDALWPDTYVTVSSLNRLLTEIRGALGEAPSDERFIRTVHRVGYAFVAAVDWDLSGSQPREAAGRAGAGAAAGMGVWLVLDQREVELGPGEHVLGRSRDCAVRVDHGGVSRHHARLIVGPEGVMVEDLGTFVNGTRIERRVALADGDEVGVGTVLALLRLTDPERSTETWSGVRAR